jgi:erythromycin esterase-like protein
MERLARDGYDNVHIRHGDGTLGWPEAAPFDAIVVAAGGPEVPRSLYRTCEPDVVRVLDHLQHKRLEYARRDGEHVFDAIENARVAVGAEAYYRAMYYGSHESWNLRDRHMVGTLERLLQFYGPSSKAVVWAHNSHVGDASGTDLAARGELNVGQRCRRQFVKATYIIGFGTDHGTVAAASYSGSGSTGHPVPTRAGR